MIFVRFCINIISAFSTLAILDKVITIWKKMVFSQDQIWSYHVIKICIYQVKKQFVEFYVWIEIAKQIFFYEIGPSSWKIV